MQSYRVHNFIKIGFIILAILMPVWNVFLQFFNKILGVSEYLAIVKDVLVFAMMTLMVTDLLKSFLIKKNKFEIKFFIPLILVIIATLWSFISSFWINRIAFRSFTFGFYFELWWLWFFAVTFLWINQFLRQNSPDLLKKWVENIKIAVLLSYLAVAIFCCITLFFGQTRVLSSIGYSQEISLESGLLSATPICHPIDFNVDFCRLMGTFTHPIHFGSYLIFVLSLLLYEFSRSKHLKSRIIYFIGIISNLIFVFLTFSRFAWFGVLILFFGIFIYLLAKLLQSKLPQNILNFAFKSILSLILLINLFIGLVFINLDPNETSKYLPVAISKPSSSTFHYRHVKASMEILSVAESRVFTGFGLSSSGSSVRAKYQDLNQNFIIQNYQSIAQKNGLNWQQIAFPENWFLQVWLNGGIFYLAIYLILTALPLNYIFKLFKNESLRENYWPELLFGFGFLAIFVGNLFLHLWENQATVVFWTLFYLISFVEIRSKHIIIEKNLT